MQQRAKRAASRSDVQRETERIVIDLVGQRLGVPLVPQRLPLRDCRFDVDGYYDGADRTVLVEAWAHVGAAKSAQHHKVLSDLLKLALLRRLLQEDRPSRPVECYLAFIDEDAVYRLRNQSWAALAAAEFGVQTLVIDVGAELRESVRQAQIRQDIRVTE